MEETGESEGKEPTGESEGEEDPTSQGVDVHCKYRSKLHPLPRVTFSSTSALVHNRRPFASQCSLASVKVAADKQPGR
jgi:hypothetical protein